MANIFRTDGPLYKVMTVIYNLLVLNILWVVFSIPFLTIGASTTALFYVTGKILRGENFSSLPGAFWKSFKLNLKQATIIWVILIVVFYLLLINIQNVGLLGNMAKFFYAVQLVALVELLIVGIYIFPLLSRHHVTIGGALRAAFYIGNRHILTTIMCLAVIPGLYYLLMIHGVFIMGIMPIYSFWISYLLRGKFEKYMD